MDARLTLRATRFRRHANPFEFALERLLPFTFRLFLAPQTLLLLFQPRRVIAFPRDALAAIQFENPTRDVVQEISIVGHRDDGSRITLQVMFEPRDRLGIQVIRRLVEQKYVGLLQEQPTQRNPATFAAGQHLDRRV